MFDYANPTPEQIKAAIFALLAQDREEVSTIEIIEACCGKFVPERGVQVYRSSNAAIGRQVSWLAPVLGIEKCWGAFKVDGGDGRRTTTRRWKRRS